MLDSKDEIEEFTYIVSHDLRAPLRHIKTFSELLIESLGNELSEDQRDYVHVIQNSVNNIYMMMDALREYSNLNSGNRSLSHFNSRDLIDEVLHDLTAEINEKQAEIHIGAFSDKIWADRDQIKRVFSEIIKNALRFNQLDIAPVIWISTEKKQDQLSFSISDNGLGIPEKNKTSVFDMFNKINPEHEGSGTGVGLCLAKKIISLHGGTIRIEPIEPLGTQVIFTLPVKTDN